jgi:hypothetical protein
MIEERSMKTSTAEILREYGPFPGVEGVHGVTYDGHHIWFASGDRLNAFDPGSGKTLRSMKSLPMQERPSTASTCFRSPRIASRRSIRRPAACSQRSRRPAAAVTQASPGGEGTLWVGQHRDGKIHQVDPQTGAILRTIESNRFVTGVTWVDDELWHGTWEGDESDVRRVDPRSGEVLEKLEMPPGVLVSGLESDGGDQFFCGGGSSSAKVRAVRRPRRGSATGAR